MGHHILIHLEDSATKQKLVEQAWLKAGGRREHIFQTESPREVLQMMEDFKGQILAVVTDNEINGEGEWALKVVDAAKKAEVPHILVYSGNIPVSLAPTIARVARTASPQQDGANLGKWFSNDVGLHAA